jgi:hypothetical protein
MGLQFDIKRRSASYNRQHIQDAVPDFSSKCKRFFCFPLSRFAERLATLLDLPIDAVWEPSNHRNTVEARGLLCYWLVCHLGESMSSLPRRLRISTTSLNRSVARDEALWEGVDIGFRIHVGKYFWVSNIFGCHIWIND